MKLLNIPLLPQIRLLSSDIIIMIYG